MPQTEAPIQAACRRTLRDAGGWEFKAHQTGMGRSGIPDIIGCYLGCMIAIEVKRKGGRVRPLQLVELHAIRDAGGVALLIDDAKVLRAALTSMRGSLRSSRMTIDRISEFNELPPVPVVDLEAA